MTTIQWLWIGNTALLAVSILLGSYPLSWICVFGFLILMLNAIWSD